MALNRQSGYCCFANVHMVMEAVNDPSFTQNVNNATVVFPDGKPIAKMVEKLGKKPQERVAGMDFMPAILNLCATRNLKVFFFGTSNEILDKIKNRALVDYPGLKIAGILSPKFGDFSEKENSKYLDEIILSGANLVMVALGCPKQEKWMANNYQSINAPLLGLGAAFSVYARVEKRAPIWMQNLSLEWLFRLFTNPGRLWKRYLFTNSAFVWAILPYLLGKKNKHNG